MQIVEVKNNLVKVSYDTAQENLILSGFVVIKDSAQSFIGQIIHLDANSKGNFAVIKLLFVFGDDGVIINYNGSIPSYNSIMDIVQPNELLELLPVQYPIIIGDLAQQSTLLKLDRTFLEENLLVCCENDDDNKLLTKNLVKQLVDGNKKVLIIDCIGNLDFSSNKITAEGVNNPSRVETIKIIAGTDFKLPLNYETINFIYEKGLDDASSETKALIQDVFLEVQNYVKTLSEKFIPFETFKDVVDSQYEEMDLVELVLLKNKLLKYYEEGVFAQDRKEFDSLRLSLQNTGATIFDLSNIDDNVQREMISYAYSLINQFDEKIYVVCNINNTNSDKKLLKQFFMTNKAYSTLICSYAYKYLKELKQLSKNLILFAPIQQQNDFAGYNTFLNKLNAHEFVIYGKATHYLPLIVKLDEITQEIENGEQIGNPDPSPEDMLDEEIRRDVDEIYTAPKKDDEFSVEIIDDEFTEEDLDFIDDLGIGGANEEGNDVPPEEESVSDLTPDGESSNYYQEGVNDLSPEENSSYSQEDVNDLTYIEESHEQYENEGKDFLPEEENVQETYEGFNDIQEEEIIEGANQETSENSFTNVLNQQAQEEIEPPAVDILPVKMASIPIVPVYSADVEIKAQSDEIEQGDTVTHPKYGKGTVEKLITYGAKTLCSINFDNVGRRLLDPTLVEIKKI